MEGRNPSKGLACGAISWVRALAVAILFTLVMWAAPGQARLQPYYVVESEAGNLGKPRVLLIVDTSGSMVRRRPVAPDDWVCDWNDCETPGAPEESNISIARRTLHEVIQLKEEQIDFGLMTFNMLGPPTSVPPKCNYTAGPDRRFIWIDTAKHVNWGGGGTPQVNPIAHYTDASTGLSYQGTWAICSGFQSASTDIRERYGFPYIAWNNIGVGSVITADDQTGPVPPSPLISTVEADMKSETNARRQVQWFPRFMGLRINLNNTTDPGEVILQQTVGDYAPAGTLTQLRSNVKFKDFYYWPYVDGFPGYADWRGDVSDPNYVRPDLGPLAEWRAGVQWPGVGPGEATLFVPFFLEPDEVTAAGLSGNAVGPRVRREMVDLGLGYTDRLHRGGLDPVTRFVTPWLSAIGGVPGSVSATNGYYSHTTVASYLHFMRNSLPDSLCRPIKAVLITDGYPAPAAEGGPPLYKALADLRDVLGVPTYVVGVWMSSASELHAMACAAAGACDGVPCTTPCDDTPKNAWDTCADPSAPATCAFQANSGQQLADTLLKIVDADTQLTIPSGRGARVGDFAATEGGLDAGARVQTEIEARTDYPGWKGHVTRKLCDDTIVDEGGSVVIAPWCQPPVAPPEVGLLFGPCPAAWEWDAGECLRIRGYQWRRVYTHDENNRVIDMYDSAAAAATNAFRDLLVREGILVSGDLDAQATAFAEFIQGRDWDGAWKLPGLGRSAPVVVRRIPQLSQAAPSVPLRDPHCGGRLVPQDGSVDVHPSLRDYARQAWERMPGASPHYESQEAVLVGDDLGMLHAFHLQSGNELWGLMPRFMLATAAEQWRNGPANAGQPEALADHIHGLGATVNVAWVFDVSADRWRHLAVFGFGPGGTELMAIDVSHMSPFAPSAGRPSCELMSRCPVEVLWTSEDPALAADYDTRLGETWSRPALALEVPSDRMDALPVPWLVSTSGYEPLPMTPGQKGRSMLLTNALTGEIEDWHYVRRQTLSEVYEPTFGTLVDPVVVSHCRSRLWAEMQEAYVADPNGRLYRWDLGHRGTVRDGEADSGSPWPLAATEALTFYACEGAGDRCTVPTDFSKGHREPFAFPPAVTANDRVDDFGSFDGATLPGGDDQMLIALISGSADDDTLVKGGAGEAFHSSLYMLVDDHRSNPSGGFDVPPGQPKVSPGAVGTYPHYARVALSDLWRRRDFTPFPGAPSYSEAARFRAGTRPTRAPRILVRGLLDGTSGASRGDTEVYEISFGVFEPGANTCDPRFFDAAKGVWHHDAGSNYEITFRLTADADGFDFAAGATNTDVDFGSGFARGLTKVSVVQQREGECADGNCAPRTGNPGHAPCEVELPPGSGAERARALSLQTVARTGFVPAER